MDNKSYDVRCSFQNSRKRLYLNLIWRQLLIFCTQAIESFYQVGWLSTLYEHRAVSRKGFWIIEGKRFIWVNGKYSGKGFRHRICDTFAMRDNARRNKSISLVWWKAKETVIRYEYLLDRSSLVWAHLY